MKTLKIEIPKGYEIDKEKSTFENIVFKLTKKELPKSWEELKGIKGYYVTLNSNVVNVDGHTHEDNKNIFATKEQAEASIALAQLSQLREVYRDGWVPDFTDDDENKFCITFHQNKLCSETLTSRASFFSFQDPETRDLFLENFRDLIETAKTLLS